MRDAYEPISHDTDPASRRRRLRRTHRDLALHLAGGTCPACRSEAWLSGGTGCDCAASSDLAARCADIAAGGCYCEQAS